MARRAPLNAHEIREAPGPDTCVRVDHRPQMFLRGHAVHSISVIGSHATSVRTLKTIYDYL